MVTDIVVLFDCMALAARVFRVELWSDEDEGQKTLSKTERV